MPVLIESHRSSQSILKLGAESSTFLSDPEVQFESHILLLPSIPSPSSSLSFPYTKYLSASHPHSQSR
jgi:hypothetical protein